MKYFLASIVIIVGLYMEITLFNMWQADQSYALGKNYDSISQYVAAYPYLTKAVDTSPGEPAFKDELAYNQAVIASAIFLQIKDSTNSAIASLSAEAKMELVIPQLNISTADLINQAVSNSNQVVENSPNSMPFWKSRTKTFYQLGTIDPKYFLVALEAIKKCVELAPTDAKVHYNLALLYAKTGQKDELKKTLEETLKLKPDYAEVKEALKEL